MTREEIIEAAILLHDDACGCDRKYLMSCPAMTKAILQAGRDLRLKESGDAAT